MSLFLVFLHRISVIPNSNMMRYYFFSGYICIFHAIRLRNGMQQQRKKFTDRLHIFAMCTDWIIDAIKRNKNVCNHFSFPCCCCRWWAWMWKIHIFFAFWCTLSKSHMQITLKVKCAVVNQIKWMDFSNVRPEHFFISSEWMKWCRQKVRSTWKLIKNNRYMKRFTSVNGCICVLIGK